MNPEYSFLEENIQVSDVLEHGHIVCIVFCAVYELYVVCELRPTSLQKDENLSQNK